MPLGISSELSKFRVDRNRQRDWCAAIVAFILLTSLVILGGGTRERAAASKERLPNSRPGRMWVLNANVKEQVPGDSRHHADMRRFVIAALQTSERHAPDVVLLQQVNSTSTEWLRKAFSLRTGNRFAIVVGPSEQTRVDIEPKELNRRNDSAILINRSSARVISSGKFRVTQRRRYASRKPIQQVVPWATIAERRGDLHMTVTSIHYPTHGAFRNRRMSFSQKAGWSVRLSRLIRRQRPDSGDGHVPVLAGDFNALKCHLGTSDYDKNCRQTKLWKTLAGLRYREALDVGEYSRMDRNIIDFVFTRGNISDVFWDYGFHQKNYSDHGVAAVLLEDQDTTPPYKPHYFGLRMSAGQPYLYGWANRHAFVGWDGGSGFKHWLIYRTKLNQNDWQLIGHSRDDKFTDSKVDIDGGDAFRYRVAAMDRAGNISQPSNSKRIPE